MFYPNFFAAVLISIVASLLTACSSGPYRINLMPAPDVYESGALEPFADENPMENMPYAGMLYATDRKPVVEGDAVAYGNERGRMLRLGSARIGLARGQITTWEEARQISLLKTRSEDYPMQVMHVDEFGVLAESATAFDRERFDPAVHPVGDPVFAAAVNEKLAVSNRKDVYVYVHGYKVVFDNPVLVASELWHFLGYEGAFIAYAWPSTPSRWAYASDLETAAYSSRHFRIFLEYLARETDAERIHIVGYSAGTRVVIGALIQLALKHPPEALETLRIGNVVLIGSDFDRQIFGGYIDDGLLSVADRTSIYASSRDKALGFSRFIFGRQRLGQLIQEGPADPAVAGFLQDHPELVLIDVSDVEGSDEGNGHAYFRQSPWASSDILMTLMYDLDPEARGLVQAEDIPFWSFPPDYISRLRSALAERGVFTGE